MFIYSSFEVTIKKNLKRTVKWNKYRLQMSIQPQNKNLNYLIDSTVTKVNRLFVLPFVRNAEGDHRDSFSHYYVPNARIKDFNVLIDGKSFFYFPAKDEEEAYEKFIVMSINNDYTTGNLLDFAYFKKNYKLIANDLSKQTNLKGPQQISFIGRLLAARKIKKKLLLNFYKILQTSYNTFNEVHRIKSL